MRMMDIEQYFLDEWSEAWLNAMEPHVKNKDDWGAICSNKNLTLNMIEKYMKSTKPNKHKMNWKAISDNPNLTLDFVIKYQDKKWNLNGHKREYYFNISSGVFANLNIKPESIDFYNQPKLYRSINNNPNLTMDFILSHPSPIWDWSIIIMHKNITIDDVLQHPEFPWNYKNATQNPNFTLDMLLTKLADKWDYVQCIQWGDVSVYDVVTMNDVNMHPNLPWNWNYLSCSKKITMDDIEQNPDSPWDWDYIEINPNLTLEFVKRHPEIPWNWNFVTMNDNITMDDIEQNPNLPWNYTCIAKNPNLTVKFFRKYNCFDFVLYRSKPIFNQTFDNNREIFLEHSVCHALIWFIYDYYQNLSISQKRKRFDVFDSIFMDCFIVKTIQKY
jgi:hypothetical protein